MLRCCYKTQRVVFFYNKRLVNSICVVLLYNFKKHLYEKKSIKFDLISKVNSERNNWGHKSGQKALVNSFEAAMLVLVSQMQEKY